MRERSRIKIRKLKKKISEIAKRASKEERYALTLKEKLRIRIRKLKKTLSRTKDTRYKLTLREKIRVLKRDLKKAQTVSQKLKILKRKIFPENY